MTALPVRQVARLIVLDAEGSILLVRYRDHRDTNQAYWATPGGRIEVGETPEEAAERELREETGLHARIGALLWKQSFSWDSPAGYTEQSEAFYLVRLAERRPEVRNTSPEPIEIHRWWSTAELGQALETVYPEDLVERLGSFLAG